MLFYVSLTVNDAKKKRMDEEDTGQFEYNFEYVPLCVKPCESQLPAYKRAMTTAVIDYLRDSREHGMKPSNTILQSGLSVGEAAVLFIRQRGKACLGGSPLEEEDISEYVADCVSRHYKMVVHRELFRKFVNAQTFARPEYAKKLLVGLKRFFKVSRVPKRKVMESIEQVLSDVKQWKR